MVKTKSPRICTLVPGCKNAVYSKKMCRSHYNKFRVLPGDVQKKVLAGDVSSLKASSRDFANVTKAKGKIDQLDSTLTKAINDKSEEMSLDDDVELESSPVLTGDSFANRKQILDAFLDNNLFGEEGQVGTLEKVKQYIINVVPSTAFKKNEYQRFLSLVAGMLRDFMDEELCTADIDDIIDYATCRVEEIRLYSYQMNRPQFALECAGQREKLAKRIEKKRENLLSRRADRKDLVKGGLSILDLAADYDERKKKVYDDEVRKLIEEEEEFTRQHPIA